jgi:predicted phage baseplate assembly protein
MPLPVPNLDDRRFQDILDEARRLIPRYCPEWTDHNLSDPGITLLELFSWMTDMMLYRLNRVPEKNYTRFLELMGVQLEPAKPATVDVTFRLTSPPVEDLVIPRGTEVATVRTDTEEAVSFATDSDLTIRVPRLSHVLAGRAGGRFHNYQVALEDPTQGLGVFSDVPRENDAVYLGFANDIGGNTLIVHLQCRMEGIGIDPTDPPLAWETWDSLDARWVPVTVREDTTRGLNGDGTITVDVPYGIGPTPVDGKLAYWLRCRVTPPRPGTPGYSDSPRILDIEVQSIGGLAAASHRFKVEREVVGTSDGTPGQTFRLMSTPVLPRSAGEYLEVQGEGGIYEPWIEVPDFSASTEADPHYTLESVSGTITLGPRIRTPDGREQQYGRAPISGRALRFTRYWSGGGVAGNTGAGTITVLKSSIPYVAWVNNFTPALGGTDSEDLEHAKMRGPRTLRTHERAVSAQDFEILALQSSPAVARARCKVVGGQVSTTEAPESLVVPLDAPGEASAGVAAPGAGNADLSRLLGGFSGVRRSAATGGRPTTRITQRNSASAATGGFVRLLLVPRLTDVSSAITPDQLQLTSRIRQDVHQYLDDRRLVTCELVLGTPVYTWVSVAARLRARPNADKGLVALRAREALNRYIHPVLGGPDGQGWPFGRELFLGEVYSLLQQVEGLDVIEDVSLYHIDPATGASGQPVTRLSPGAEGLLCSSDHRITVQ